MLDAASSALDDLYGRGVLRKHVSALTLPGEVGSGYKSGANLGHVEPEEIYLLGTSHLSQRSAVDVQTAIDALEPDAVVIELCRSRSGLLYADDVPTDDKASNAFGLSGEGGPLAVLSRSLALGGWAPLLLRVLLVRLSSQAGAGVAPGVDFRAARRGATASNATLVLGDRPVEITLERAWRALSWGDRGRALRAAWSALGAPASGAAAGSAGAGAGLLEAALGGAEGGAGAADATLAAMEAALAREYPALVAPLIRERDIYLSLTLKSSRAVSGTRRVLGVIGRGHLEGVCAALGEDHAGGFKALTWTPSRAAAKQRVLGLPKPLVTRLVFDASLGVALWWLYAAPASGSDALALAAPLAGAIADAGGLQPPRMGDFSGSFTDVIYNNFALEGGFLLLIASAIAAVALADPKRDP